MIKHYWPLSTIMNHHGSASAAHCSAIITEFNAQAGGEYCYCPWKLTAGFLDELFPGESWLVVNGLPKFTPNQGGLVVALAAKDLARTRAQSLWYQDIPSQIDKQCSTAQVSPQTNLRAAFEFYRSKWLNGIMPSKPLIIVDPSKNRIQIHDDDHHPNQRLCRMSSINSHVLFTVVLWKLSNVIGSSMAYPGPGCHMQRSGGDTTCKTVSVIREGGSEWWMKHHIDDQWHILIHDWWTPTIMIND